MKTPGVKENNIIHTELITTPVGNGNFLIKDSFIDTDGSIGAQGDLTIKNSNVKTYGAASMTQSSVITIDESTISLLSNTIRQMSDLGIVGTFMVSPNKIVVKDNSKIYSNGIIMSYNTVEVIDSEIKGSNEYDINYIPALVVYEKLTATNSSFDLTGPALIKQIELNNSILSSQSGDSEKIAQETSLPVDYSTSSALVAKTVELNNSNLIAISHADIPAIMIIDPLISNNENQIFVNGENAIESFEIVNYSDYGFLPTNGFNNITLTTIGVTNNEGYTALLNGEASYDVRTSEKVTVKLKIENGTWEDGSTDDIEVILIKGELPNKDTIKSISLIEGGILTIKETGENEYTFIYSKVNVENPKTGVESLTLLLISSLTLIVIIAYYKNNFSLFKRI